MGDSRKIIGLVIAAIVAACHGGAEPPGDGWTTAQWTAAGVPDPKRAWTPDELKAAVEVIKKSVGEDAHRLPKFHGANGGELFSRVTAAPTLDPKAEVRAAFGAAFTTEEAHRAFSTLYQPDGLTAPTREFVESFGSVYDDDARLLPLCDPFIATFGSDDPTVPARRGGLQKMLQGTGQMIVGGIMVAADLRVAEADRVALLGYIGHVLPVSFAGLSPDDQATIRANLGKLVDGSSGDLHTAAAAVQRLLPP
jgi:hypothetical protein